MVRPKLRKVSAREVCAIASSAESDLGAMSWSKRRTSGDLSSARLSSVLANDIALISRGARAWQTLADARARSRDCGIDFAPRRNKRANQKTKAPGQIVPEFSKEWLGLRRRT